MKYKNKAIFLDRDGIINRDIGYLFKIKDFVFLDGIFDACNYFQNAGYLIIIITNQSGIARGYYNEEDFHQLTHWMLKKFLANGITINDIFFCPHAPNDGCNCRKPEPGLIQDAIQKYNINLTKSWMIGDKESDVKAANIAGITNTILVKTGYEIDELMTSAKFKLKSIKESIQLIN